MNNEQNLATLLALVAEMDMPPLRKRDILSAIRTVAKALDTEPQMVPLDVKFLRHRLGSVTPESIGLSRGYWRNVRSRLNRALELKVKLMPSAQKAPVSQSWKVLEDSLPTSAKYRLGTLFRFLSGRGIEPSEFSPEHFEEFRMEVIEKRLRASPAETCELVAWCWNKLSNEVDKWPKVMLPRHYKRKTYSLQWSEFPSTLKADVDAYIQLLGGEVLDDEGPLKPLRPQTLKNREYQFRAAASALVTAGVPAEQIQSIRDIARLAPMKLIVEAMLRRNGSGPLLGNKHHASVFSMASALKAAARHYVKVEDDELNKIRRIVAKLAPRSIGLTPKNRDRLSAFNDPAIVRRFLALPKDVTSKLRKSGRKTVTDAITAQNAVAIAILQAVPIRLGNLATLDLERHLIERGNRLYVQIPGEEVKNGRPYELELPDDVAHLIAWYCTEYRGLLLRAPTQALFPGGAGGPKSTHLLGTQITKLIKKQLGISVHTHLFRHIAAKIYLEAHPNQYAVVALVLNHKSVVTTMKSYTGMETATASRHFQGVVQNLREVPLVISRKGGRK